MLGKTKIKSFEKTKLLAFVIENASKFVDLIIGALNNPKGERYRFYHVVKGSEIGEEGPNNAEYVVDILNKYNQKLKVNVDLYKTKRNENNNFTNSYKTFKLLTKSVFGTHIDNPFQLFKELLLMYSSKNYPLSPNILTRNLFNNSPLLIMSQNDLFRYFTIDMILNGFESLGRTKTIFFLKKLQEDLNEIVEKSNKKKHKRSQSTIIKLSNKRKEITELMLQKKEITKIEELLKQEEKQYKEDYFTKSKKIPVLPCVGTSISGSTYYSSSMKKLKFPSNLNSNSISIKEIKKQILSKESGFDESMSSSRRGERSKSPIELAYEEMKSHALVLHRNKSKIDVSLLSAYSVSKTGSELNPTNTSKDLLNSLMLLKNKVEVTNVKRIMNKIYNNKIPKIMTHKLNIEDDLDNKLKTLNLDLVKSMIKVKIKNKS